MFIYLTAPAPTPLDLNAINMRPAARRSALPTMPDTLKWKYSDFTFLQNTRHFWFKKRNISLFTRQFHKTNLEMRELEQIEEEKTHSFTVDWVHSEHGGRQEAGGGPEEQPGDGRVVEQHHHHAVHRQVGEVEGSGTEAEHPDCQPATGWNDSWEARRVSFTYFIFNFLFDPLDSV